MKKKITAMLVCAAVIMSLTACSSDSESSSPETSTSTKSSTESSKTESSLAVSNSGEIFFAPEETSAPETVNIDWSTVPVVDEMDLNYTVLHSADEVAELLPYHYYIIINEMKDRGKDSAIEITDYYGDAEYINLPDSIEGNDFIICVTNWGENAKAIRFPESYSSCSLGSAKNIISADIPDSWQYVGQWSQFKLPEIKIPAEAREIVTNAFTGCTKPKSVTIPEKVKYIGMEAFASCRSLEQVNFPKKFAGECVICASAFSECTSLKSIELPEGVVTTNEYVCGNMFSDCTALEKVTLPSTLTSIEARMFLNCTSLTDVKLSSSVKTIGTRAFKDCTSLKSIDIPDSVTYIEYDAFNGCTDISINYKGNTYNEESIKKLYDRDLSDM